MDDLLVLSSVKGIPQSLSRSLRLAGWTLTVTTDIVAAKQLLQTGAVAGVMIDINTDRAPERLSVVRFVHEFCPAVMVIMLHSWPDAVAHLGGDGPARSLGVAVSMGTQPKRAASLDQYHLTPRQKRIAELTAQAYPNREIGRQLNIQDQSVRNELSRIFRKMGVWNRVRLALLMGSLGGEVASNPMRPGKTEFGPIGPAPDINRAA